MLVVPLGRGSPPTSATQLALTFPKLHVDSRIMGGLPVWLHTHCPPYLHSCTCSGPLPGLQLEPALTALWCAWWMELISESEY